MRRESHVIQSGNKMNGWPVVVLRVMIIRIVISLEDHEDKRSFCLVSQDLNLSQGGIALYCLKARRLSPVGMLSDQWTVTE